MLRSDQQQFVTVCCLGLCRSIHFRDERKEKDGALKES